MTTKAKATQANYSADMISAIIAEYAELMDKNANDNKIVLKLLSDKHGKTVPSLRAKLASLKVYRTADKVDNAPAINGDKTAKKEDIAQAISAIVGVELVGLEAATKAALQAILVYLLKVSKLLEEKEAKINDLIGEMLENSDNA